MVRSIVARAGATRRDSRRSGAPLAALVAVALLPAWAAHGADELPAEPAPDAPPAAASPADRALWTSAREVDVAVPITYRALSTLQGRITGSRLRERLAAVATPGAGGAGPSDASRAAQAALERLDSAWGLSSATMGRRWKVDPTRACAYPLLNFETALPDQQTEKQRADLASARLALRECVESARAMLKALDEARARLEGARADGEKLLAAPAVPASPGAPAPPPGGR